jgi:hypothetical protein
MPTWWLNSLNALEKYLLPCPFKWLTGCDCPACGMQRSIIHTLRGDIEQSWQANPGGVILLLGIVVHVATLLFNVKQKRPVRIAFAGILISSLLVNWIVKIASHTCCG